ncbi:helix-turn-helix domain-containing protein [Paraburkholderia rhizosphaerae]|uniref:Transcriptional regulator GlxA family with amidase domain n=1 Tax=Paraburkholderia rhizosphaerae TaxID=480658 RepID=A0A4R8LC52_9BURK|nr:helix-turn-helix domain-containing protein [Paraburkholderia rhizosphaerae]TDY40511.1 transcriptional regulator GlxA family with amidase domain [Paraburkholderia rhizosphaerae]
MPYVAQPEQSDSIVGHFVKEAETISADSIDPETVTRRPARQIGIVLFEGFSLLRAGIVAAVFNKANQLAAAKDANQLSVAKGAAGSIYTIRMLSIAGGSVPCSSSVQLWTDPFDVRQYQNYDALFVVGGEGAPHPSLEKMLLGRTRFGYTDKLFAGAPLSRAAAAASGSMRAADRSGFGGQRTVDSDDDCFSSMASALMLVKYDLGHDVAREVGEQLLPGARVKLALLLAEGGVTSVQDKVRASARWLKDNCERPISVADAAQVAAMSERNYQRRFKDEIGMTPSDYLLRARLDMVCRLLIETDLPVDKIARRIGMANGDRLAKIFRKRMLVSPTEYRSQHRQAPDSILIGR